VNKVSNIGSLLKRIYRFYSGELLNSMQKKGFTDLRASFLEVLLFICENEGPTIKQIGAGCGLKKQTMTSHLNELEKRGYIKREVNLSDKRAQKIFLTEYGEKFKLNLFQSVRELEQSYTSLVGEVELLRVEHLLENFHLRITEDIHEAQ
jgi:DNA-binding MarR family transcriptional regulator